MQLEAISSSPASCYQVEQADLHLATNFLQVVVESSRIPLESPFPKAKQLQLPQVLLTGIVLQDPSPASMSFFGQAPAM